MKMAKASEKDIAAAGDAMSVLNDISSGYYPKREGDECEDMFFDEENPEHLRKFYDLMTASLEAAPGWPGRVIGGMCYVILFGKNEILDPDADVLELHPRFAKARLGRDELLECLKLARAYMRTAIQSDTYRADPTCQRIESALAKHQPTTAGEGPAIPT